MKYLAGVLALAALAAAEPEADPVHALYAPYALPFYLRPYYASGYAGPLPSGYQSVHRLHRREADPQLLLSAAPFPTAHAVFNAPLVKSVVEAPAVVSHTVHAAPLAFHAPLTYAAAPVVHAAPVHTAVVGLDAHDCVTEGGCALKAALTAGLPAATVGSTSIYGRKRREAEAEAEADATADATADADADADADAFYGYYGYNAYAARPYGYGYGYNALPYSYAPYYRHAAYAPYAYAPYNYAPYTYAPYTYAPAPVVEAAPVAYHAAPVVSHAPVVETVAKEVTYTHLGAHPISPTTVVETQSRLVGR